MTGVLAILAGVDAIRVNAPDANVDGTVFDPNTLICSYSLDALGTTTTVDDSGSSTLAGDWITPTSEAPNYEVRATLNSGSLFSGTTGSWLALNVDRAWLVRRTSVGTQTANLTLELRRTGTSTVIDTATVTITATVEP